MAKQALLYLHIPFCIHPCRYCTACVVTGDSDTKRIYLEALKNEITAALPTLADYSFPAVYFGGGSPSVMRPDDMAALLRSLKQCLNLEKGVEISIEVMPQTVGTPSLVGLKAGGYSRISLSMQSAVPEELIALDCGFTVQDVQNAVLFCDRFHFNNINLDIMYGIPGQTERSMNSTLRTVEAYDPSHISLYPFPGLTEIVDNPNESDYVADTSADDLRKQAEAYLAKIGYHQYTAYHFAKDGRESKYFRLRYEGMDYFGLGLGARSLINDIACSNTTDLDTYITHSGDYEQIVVNVMQLTPEEKQEYVAVGRAMLL